MKVSYAWRAPQCDLRDPGRGDPGFRRCWECILLDTFARSCFVVGCFVGLFHVQDLLIRRHTCCGGLMEPSCQYLRGWLLGFGLVFCLGLWCFLFVFGLLCSASLFILTRLRFGLVCAPLSNPQRGIQCMHTSNSFNQHNNVRRPGESHRGAGRKKKRIGTRTK